MKFPWHVFIPSLMICAIFAGAFIAWQSTMPPQCETAVCAAYNNPISETAQIPAAIRASPEDRIADYTFWLTICTGGLVVIGAFQVWLLLGAEKTTRRAADAATESARIAASALTFTQRAWMSVKEHMCIPIREVDGHILGWRLSVKWENVGNTPAKRVTAGVVVMEVPLDGKTKLGPFYDLDEIKAKGAVIGARHAITATGKHEKDFISMGQVQRVIGKEIELFLCSLIDYIDVFERETPRQASVCVRVLIEDEKLIRPNPFGYQVHTEHNDST